MKRLIWFEEIATFVARNYSEDFMIFFMRVELRKAKMRSFIKMR